MKFLGITTVTELLKFADLLKVASLDITESDELDENLETLTEWEYKYHKIFNASKMNPKRKDNILRMVEREIRPVINSIIDSLSYVFADWIKQHALLDAHQWAAGRVDQELIEAYSGKNAMQIAEHEYKIYNGGKNNFNDEFLVINFKYFEDIIQKERNYLIEKEYEDFNEAELHEDAEEMIRIKENIERLESMQTSNEDIFKEFVYEFGIGENIADYTYENQNLEYMLINFYENVLFPLWFEYWEDQGIVETRKDIEREYARLQSARNEPLSKALMSINLALQSSHQTGPMLDHINNMYYKVNKDFLDDLSNKDEDVIQQWDADLSDKGVW